MNSVEYKETVRRYNAAGIRRGFKLRNTEDIKKAVGIDVEAIRGFDTLKIAKGMFKKFMVNFLNEIHPGERREIKPVSVRIVREGKGAFLKFIYQKGKLRKEVHISGTRNYKGWLK